MASGDSDSTNREMHVKKLREAFAVLTQGVEITCYDVNERVGARKQTKIVWIDPDILRICCDKLRPSMAERAMGKIAPGIYIRDISEIREGFNSYHFRQFTPRPVDEDRLMSIIGTERTISLELPSQFTRDWFSERFKIIINDILLDEEKQMRNIQGRSAEQLTLSAPEQEAVTIFANALKRGVQVIHHHPNGKIIPSLLVFEESKKILTLQSEVRSIFLFWQAAAINILLSDISEIRSGCHSIGFVRTDSLDKGSELLSVIATENVFDLQLASESTRDTFLLKFRLFVKYYKSLQDDRAL